MADQLLDLTGLAYFKQQCDATYITEDDVPVKSVKLQGSTLTPDAQGAVDIVTPFFVGVTGGGGYDGVSMYYPSGATQTAEFGVGYRASENQVWMQINKDSSTQSGSLYIPTTAKVEAMIAAAQVGVTWDIVTDLPATGTPGKMYLKGPIGSGTNIYEEWIWINTGTEQAPNWVWENIGTTAIDLSGYVQKTDIELITTAQIDALFATATPTP